MTEGWRSHFSKDYSEAREKFRSICKESADEMRVCENPNKSPHGDSLSTDVAWFGPKDAERVLVVMSGTHGLEGLCGSGCQIAWASEKGKARLPNGLGVLLVHSINPYGVAWIQRETEGGVDLNRNFVDHNGIYRKSSEYEEIRDALLCPDLEGEQFEKADAVINAYRDRHGLMGLGRAMLGGQHKWPDGMNFGGLEPTWSHLTFIDLLKRYASQARFAALLDYHTGFGPYMHASMITHSEPENELARRALDWFGPTVWPVGSTDPTSHEFIGETGKGFRSVLGDAETTPVTVEYGTYDMDEEIRVIRRDLWLRHHGDPKSELGQKVKTELLEYFYPDDDNWKEMVWRRSQQIIRQAINALAKQV